MRSHASLTSAAIYALVCIYPTYLVGSAPGQDITFWRLFLYAVALIGSIAFGALTKPDGYWLVPLVVALVWSVLNSMAAEPFFDPWYPVPLALFAGAEVMCIGFGALLRRGTVKRAFVRDANSEP
jgi:hypothetical protein